MRRLSWWLTCLLVSGLISLGLPSVALADVLDISGSPQVSLVNADSYAIANYPSTHLSGSSSSFVSGSFIDIKETFVSSGHVAYSMAESISGTTTDRNSGIIDADISLVGNEVGYSSGDFEGSFDNPNTGIGDFVYFDGSNSTDYSGQISLSGSVIGNTTSTTYGNLTCSGTGSVNGTNESSTVRVFEARPSNGFDLSNFNVVSVVIKFSGFSYYPEGVPLLFDGLYWNQIILHNDSGNDYYLNTALGRVFVTNSSKSNSAILSRATSGRYFSTLNNFSDIYVILSVESYNVPARKFDSLIMTSSPKVYRDLGYEYQQDTNTSINNQTNSINNQIQQQTVAQTNALKDTTGANSVLGAPKQIGDDIYQRVTFANQVAQISGSFATTVANADMSEAGFEFPGFTWNDTVIWETQMISPWRDIPIDIKSKIRLFNTMIFAIVWIRSLWNWIASIFGFETEKETVEYQSNMFSNNSNSDHPPDDAYF